MNDISEAGRSFYPAILKVTRYYCVEGNFVWSESGLVPEYTNWGWGEPNNNNPAGEEECVFKWNQNFEWNDSVCLNLHFALCQQK